MIAEKTKQANKILKPMKVEGKLIPEIERKVLWRS